MNRKKARICMLTTRKFARNAFRCGFYEGQDVLADVDNVDFICVETRKLYKRIESIQKDIIWHDFTGKIVSTNLAYEPIRLTKEYDLFIAYLPYWQDLIHISAIRGWKDHCRASFCWIDELWANTVQNPKSKAWFSLLKQFDYLAVGLAGTADPLGGLLGRTCHFIPGAVDAMRFSPHQNDHRRVIDVYSVGRVWEKVHRAFMEAAAKTGMFYVYDTFHASDMQVRDYREHRELLANMAKRSRCFFVAPAKMDSPGETRGQIEVGFRYYEGSAAGAVLLGQAPDCYAFKTMFDWPDVVIEIQRDGSDAGDVISRLARDPERLREISRRNAMEALMRHDWVYRWRQVLDIVGLKPAPAMEAREKRLKEMAERMRDESSVRT
jgi:hypothetical protein